MTTRPWFPFYPGDYDRDTRDLDHEQHGIYFLLLMRTWDRDTCTLPNDMDFIRRCLPKMHGLTFNRLVPPILERFFHLNEAGQWENKRMKKERRKTEELTKKQRRIAEKRWKNNGSDHATAMPSQSQSQSERKEDSIPPSGGTTVIDFTPSEDRYAFQEGVIRLKGKDLEKWKQAFAHLSVEAELIAMAHWASQQSNWFVAVSQALAKKERLAIVAIAQAGKLPAKHWSDHIL